MVDANLRHLLAEALSHTPPATLTDFALQILLQEADAGRITPHPSVTALLDCLRKEPELAMFRGQVVRDVGKGLTHVFLAEWLLGRAALKSPGRQRYAVVHRRGLAHATQTV